MRRYIYLAGFSTILLAFILVGPRLSHRFFPPSVMAEISEAKNIPLQRPDGTQINWQVHRPTALANVPLLIIAQGSGCQSASASGSVSAVVDVFSNDYAILIVEKYGVRPGDNPDEDRGEGCSALFYSKATLSQRIDDYIQVLDHLKGSPWWNGELILLGGSEGGLTMAILSSRVNASAAILISSIGDISFGDIVLNAIGDSNSADAKVAFAEARKNPAGDKLFSGSSYAYWSDAIDRNAKDYMLASDTAFLIVQGGNNTQPVSHQARAIVDVFARKGKCNLTYLELAGLDHSLIDPQGNSKLSEVTELSYLWLRTQRTRQLAAQCPTK